MEKNENNAADGPGLAYLEHPIVAVLLKKRNGKIRPRDFKNGVLRLKNASQNPQEIKRCTLPDGVWARFVADRFRVIFKHVRRLRRMPKKLSNAMAQCSHEQSLKLQRIMNLVEV